AGGQAAGAKPAPPCALVIFGAGGDLTNRLLLPALYNLSCWGLLPDRFAIIGIGRTERAVDQFRDEIVAAACKFTNGAADHKALQRITGHLAYLQGDVQDAATYRKLAEELGRQGETVGH